MGWDDTIVALATPQGIGAIGVIRLSGKRSIEIVDALFPSKNLKEQASHTIHVGFLKMIIRLWTKLLFQFIKLQDLIRERR